MSFAPSKNLRGVTADTLGIGYPEWRELVLAPIISVAAIVKGPATFETGEALRLALWHGLLTRRDENRTSSDDDARLWSKLHHPAERAQLEEKLRTGLDQLQPGDRQILAEGIWSACNDLAGAYEDGGVRVDDAERKELARIAKLLGISDDMARRTVLGADARTLEHTAEAGAISIPATSPLTVMQGGLDPCTAWAQGWNEALAERAWEDMNAMHEAHQALWKIGAGRLNDSTTAGTVPFDGPLFCDQGVQVFPAEYLDRPLYFIGDLHGDLESLEAALQAMRFFHEDATAAGAPVAVFLGDFGDRGIGTLAVWMRLAWLKRNFPERVFLLRGNHEELLEVRCVRADTGHELSTPWHIPLTLNRESYLSLGFVLSGNFEDLATTYNFLPTIALFSNGLMAVHGGPLPRWKANDGWPFGDAEKEAIRLNGIADLRKPAVQLYMRWVAPRDAGDLPTPWASLGRTYRLESSSADFDEFSGRTGISHMVHGHTHPPEGFDSKCNDRVIGVNTSLRTGRVAAIARYHPGEQRFEKITLPSP